MILPSLDRSSFTDSVLMHSFSNSSSVRGGSKTTLLISFGIIWLIDARVEDDGQRLVLVFSPRERFF